MNRPLLRYPYHVTGLILLIFVWVVGQRLARGVDAILPLAIAVLVTWPIGTLVFIGLWPRITVEGFKRGILRTGLGRGPVPVNSLGAAADRPSTSASSGGLLAVGADDLVYVGGWLDTGAGPLVLQVPEMDGRYYGLQFTDAATGASVAYVGKRTTGTHARQFLIAERNWTGEVPDGMSRVDLPHRSALVVGRVFAADDEDRRAAYSLAKQIRLTPLGGEP